MSYSWLKRGFGKTSLYRELAATGDLYEEMDKACAKSAKRLGMACPKGCDACCVGFEPDLLDREADFIAAYVVVERPDLLPALTESISPGQCPFYLGVSVSFSHKESAAVQGGCGIYPARPLVCRLFGFAGIPDKYGKPAFRPCRHMRPLSGSGDLERAAEASPPCVVGREQAVTVIGANNPGAFPSEMVLMPGFGIRNTAGSHVRQTGPLSKVLPGALNRIRYLLSLYEASAFEDRDRPPDDFFDGRPNPTAA